MQWPGMVGAHLLMTFVKDLSFGTKDKKAFLAEEIGCYLVISLKRLSCKKQKATLGI